jgi:ABC-type transport system involved in multi-copper enzyme maturation permease subunit
MRGITRDCFVEMMTRKVKWLYAVVTVIMVGSIIIVSQVRVYEDPGSLQELGARTFDQFRGEALIRVLDWFMYFLVILTGLITAGKFPTMLIPGRAEFYLSKPLSRSSLYINRMLGIFITYGGMVVACGLVGYLALYAVSSYWSDGIFYMLVLHLVGLFVWLSIITFGGVVFGSTSAAILTAVLIWFAQLALRGRELVTSFTDSTAVSTALDVLYYIVPKTGELSALTTRVALLEPVRNWLPLWSSVLFALALVVSTTVIFNRKNY